MRRNFLSTQKKGGERKMLDENKTGLVPQDFKNKNQKAIIRGILTSETKKSKEGNEYQSFSLPVEIDGKKHMLMNLMRSQLNTLVDDLGRDETAWDNQKIYIDAEKKGDFHNFIITTQARVSEETIK